MNTQTDRQTYIHAYRQIQIDRQTDRQKYGQTDKPTKSSLHRPSYTVPCHICSSADG